MNLFITVYLLGLVLWGMSGVRRFSLSYHSVSGSIPVYFNKEGIENLVDILTKGSLLI